MNFGIAMPSKIIFKTGGLNEIGTEIRDLGTRFLIVSGSGSLEGNGVMRQLESALSKENKQFVHFRGVQDEPTPQDVRQGLETARQKEIDAVIGIGGGSVIDCAKAVAGLYYSQGDIEESLEGVGTGRKITADTAPFIAIPTTAGTGAEVTKNAPIRCLEKKYKKSLRSDKMLAKLAFIDAKTTVTLGKRQTAYSGLDALCQLIESYTSKKSTPFTGPLALHAIEACAGQLLLAYQDGENLQAREAMALGSMISGICLANSGLGAAHGLAAGLGAVAGLPHGLCCGILLPYVFSYNSKSNPRRFDQVGEAIFHRTFSQPGDGTKAATDFLFELNMELQVPSDLKTMGIDRALIPEIAKASMGSSISGNPREMTEADCREILQELL